MWWWGVGVAGWRWGGGEWEWQGGGGVVGGGGRRGGREEGGLCAQEKETITQGWACKQSRANIPAAVISELTVSSRARGSQK